MYEKSFSPRSPSFVSLQTMENFSIFFLLLFFLPLAQTSHREKKAYKTLRDTSPQQLSVNTQTHGHTYIHTYIMGVFIGACQ